VAPRSIVFGAAALLDRLRDELKAGRFAPQRVREKTIPKANGKIRSLGIPTTADRIVQASLKLVLEPILSVCRVLLSPVVAGPTVSDMSATM
jgi:RNA-directed DNA polymerase